MDTYHVKLPAGSKISTRVISFDHWVSVKAINRDQAISKAIHKLAQQMRYGDKNGDLAEPCFVFNKESIKHIKYNIDPSDLEITIAEK